jgi:hypothetical protein
MWWSGDAYLPDVLDNGATYRQIVPGYLAYSRFGNDCSLPASKLQSPSWLPNQPLSPGKRSTKAG